MIRARGFTLVEVMVALAVVAVALPALMISLQQQVDGTGYLRDKSLAHMVAANKLTEIRLLAKSSQDLLKGKASGMVEMADREWYWWVASEATEVDQFYRIAITVAAEEEQREQPLQTLVAFMSADLTDEPEAEPEADQDLTVGSGAGSDTAGWLADNQEDPQGGDSLVWQLRQDAGFTLIEVLIAMAITAFVSTIAYTSLSTVMTGVESTRETAERTYEINRAWMIISRDLRQFVGRPVRDEFGEQEPAMQGGSAARFSLSFTRSGWHNPADHPRSNLQRVNYRVEGEALWRDSYTVLDRAGDTAAQSVKLLDDVEYLEPVFLASLGRLESAAEGVTVDTRNWVESWVLDTSTPEVDVAPPVAIEIRLQLMDWGEMRRLYELPSL